MRPLSKIGGDLNVTDADRDRAALLQQWRVLAPNVEQARAIRDETIKDPDRLKDPRSKALVTWLDSFERQLVAVEALATAAQEPSVELPQDDVRLARQSADDLLEALNKTHELARSNRLA